MPPADAVRPRGRRDARRAARGGASRGRPRGGPRSRRREVVPGRGAHPPDGGVAKHGDVGVERPSDRRRDPAEVPGVPDPARTEGRVADPSAPNRVRAVGPPAVRGSRAAEGRGARARRDPRSRSRRARRGQARVHQLEERAAPAVGLAQDPVRAAVSPVAAHGRTCCVASRGRTAMRSCSPAGSRA